MTQQHIMLDIETLDTTARAVVISIGAVAFTFESGEQTFPFYRSLAYDDQLKKGRTVSASTLAFWSQQSEEARGAAFGGQGRIGTEEAIHELGAFLTQRRVGDAGPLIWAYPAAFDLAIMEDLCTDFEVSMLWGHRAKRCARTLYSLAGEPDFNHEGAVIPHHPVSDCQVQITQARKAVDELNCSRKIYRVNIS